MIENHRNGPATDKQIKFLVGLGADPDLLDSMTVKEAHKEIQRLRERPTHKQQILLRRLYVPENEVDCMSKDEATNVIASLLSQRKRRV